MPRPRRIRIAVSEPLPLLRDGLRLILGAESDLEVVGTTGDGKATIALVRAEEPDVLLLDPDPAGISGMEILRRLTTEGSTTRVLLFTASISEGELLEALKLGAHGLILKDAPTDSVLKAVRVVMTGQYWFNRTTLTGLVDSLRRRLPSASSAESRRASRLREPALTPREQQVVRLIGQGASNRLVADRLGVSVDTVKHHLTNIYSKVGVSSRLELAVYAIDNGLAERSPGPGGRETL